MKYSSQISILLYVRSAEAKNMSFDVEKTAPKKRKKQMMAREMGEERKSTLSIRYISLECELDVV